MQRTALIKCPYCNHDEYVVSGDLDKAQLIYMCGKCGKEYQVEFFDYCPTCKTSVGFIESHGFKNDMKLLGKTVLNSIVNADSLWSTFGGFAQIVLDNGEDANGDGCCPICHQRYYRCSECSELVSVEHSATFETTVQCPSCGVKLSSRAAVFPSKHSRAFNEDMRMLDSAKNPFSHAGGGSSNDRNRQQKKQQQQKQKPQQVQTPCTNKRYSRSELLKIVAECDGVNPNSSCEYTVISSDADKLRNNLRSRGFNISKTQVGKVSTYGGLIDYIESHTDVTETDTSSSSMEVTNRNSQPQTNTKEDFYLLVKFTSNNPSGGVYCIVQANGSKKWPSHTRVTIKRTTGDVTALCKSVTTNEGFTINGPLLDGKEYRLEINDVSRDDIPAGAKIYICPTSVDKSEYMDTYGAGYTNGDNVGLLLEGVSAEQVKSGMMATAVKPEMSGDLSADLNNDGEGKGMENLKNSNQVQTSSQSGFSTEEQEYLDELKECLADGEIGPRERRLLDKLASKLGISPERAVELEASLNEPSLTDEEKEYLEEVQAVLADGEISEKERRLLDKLRKMLDLSEERAKEIEELANR